MSLIWWPFSLLSIAVDTSPVLPRRAVAALAQEQIAPPSDMQQSRGNFQETLFFVAFAKAAR
jgi:hypothetical protein